MLGVIELFAGLGSQTQALKNIHVPHKVIAISEIDKYANKSSSCASDDMMEIILSSKPSSGINGNLEG